MKTIKKFFTLALALMLTLTLVPVPTPAQATEAEIRVYVDGVRLVLDVAPILQNGRTLVPFRPLFETLGYKVNWDSAGQKVTGTRAGSTIELWIGNTRALVNGQPHELDVPAIIKNGRTLVPLRFVGEASGKTVRWDSERWCVYVGALPSPLPEKPALSFPVIPNAWWPQSIYQDMLDYAATKDALVTHVEATASSVTIYVAQKWPTMDVDRFVFTSSGIVHTVFFWRPTDNSYYVFYSDPIRSSSTNNITKLMFWYIEVCNNAHYDNRDSQSSKNAVPGTYPWER